MDIHQLPHPDFEKKIIARENLLAVLAQIPRPLVFTNGVFDILHRGHVSYLAQAKSFGKSKFVYIDGNLFRLMKIEDWNASEPIETKITLLRVIQTQY